MYTAAITFHELYGQFKYAFARMVQGKMIRQYSYADGRLFGCMGEKSEAEKKLSLNYAEREENLFEEGFSFMDEEDVLGIAEEWSMSPEALSGREEARTVPADRVR